MTNETFSDRLKLAMQAKQFKQVDLIRAAQRRGVKLGKSHVSQYVSGKTVPRSDILHISGRWSPGRSRLAACKRFHSKLYGKIRFLIRQNLVLIHLLLLFPRKKQEVPLCEKFKKSSKLDNVLNMMSADLS